MSNSLWTMVSFVLGALGVTYVPSEGVKSVVGAAAGLIIVVIQFEQHRTIRHHTTAATVVAQARIEAAAVAAPHPHPGPLAEPAPAHLSPDPAPGG